MSADALVGKVAIVTGGAVGMGAATVRLFAAEGARVVVADVREADGQALADELGVDALFVSHDVSKEQSWTGLIEQVVAQFGGVDILINNAGILRSAPLVDIPIEDFDAVIATNLRGVFLGMRAVVEPMTRRGGGSIVNTSSRAGLLGLPGLTAYGASKWAVRGMTKTAALELGPLHIRVNSIHPGPVDTPMVEGRYSRGQGNAPDLPLGRVGVPEDIANLHLFLASDASSWITGAEIAIDGGRALGALPRA